MLKVALIGLGTMGQMHAAAWSRIPDVQLVAISGQNGQKTEALARKFGVKAHYSLEQMLEETEFDILDICVPSYLHHAYVIMGANAGKQIICEKPLALHTGDAKEIIEACVGNNVRLFVGHDLRFSPEYESAHRVVKSGRLGKIGIVRMSRNSTFPQGWNNWFADRAKSGGVLMDLLIHDFDWLRWTFGEVKRVTARRVYRDLETGCLEYALVTLRMEDGMIAFIEGSWAHTEFHSAFEIAGTNGMLTENMADSSPLSVRMRPGSQTAAGGVVVPDLMVNENPLLKELKHFIQCLRTGNQPIVTAYDAMKAIEIAEAANESAATGRTVSLPQGVTA